MGLFVVWRCLVCWASCDLSRASAEYWEVRKLDCKIGTFRYYQLEFRLEIQTFLPNEVSLTSLTSLTSWDSINNLPCFYCFLEVFLWLRYLVSGDNLLRWNSILSVCNGWQVLIISDIFTVTQCLQCVLPTSNWLQGCHIDFCYY